MRFSTVLFLLLTSMTGFCQSSDQGVPFINKREYRKFVSNGSSSQVKFSLAQGDKLLITATPRQYGNISAISNGITLSPTILEDNPVLPAGTNVIEDVVGDVIVSLVSTNPTRMTGTYFAITIVPANTDKALALQIAYDSASSGTVIGRDVGFSVAAMNTKLGKEEFIKKLEFEVECIDTLGASRSPDFTNNVMLMPPDTEENRQTHKRWDQYNEVLAQKPVSEVAGYILKSMTLRGPRTVSLVHGRTYSLKVSATLIDGTELSQYQSFVYQEIPRVRSAGSVAEINCQNCFRPIMDTEMPEGNYRLSGSVQNNQTGKSEVLKEMISSDPHELYLELPNNMGSRQDLMLTFSLVRIKDQRVTDNLIISSGQLNLSTDVLPNGKQK